MTLPDLFLLCLCVGSLWAVASLVLGGVHIHGLHFHGHKGPFEHTSHAHSLGSKAGRTHGTSSWWTGMVNPSALAVFLAWFGGVGYLLTRYSGLMLWLNVGISLAVGVAGAWILGQFLRFLQSRDQPLDPADFEMVGVLGKVSAPIRVDGVGEVLYVREGSRRCTPARSEDHTAIARGQEVVVIRYERGIAFVRTWEAMTR